MGKETADTSIYFLTVKNEYGCESPVSDTVMLVFKPKNSEVVLSTIPQATTELAMCNNDSIEITASGAAFYQWSDGIKTSSRKLTGTGSLLLFGYDTSGCGASAADSIRFRTFDDPIPKFVNFDSVLSLNTLENQNYCVSGLPGSAFSFSVTGGEKIDSSQDCVTINWLLTTNNRLLTVTETRKEADCKGTATQSLTYRPDLKIPNFMSPNGDELNDAFVIQDLEFYASHHLQIYDRWGKKVLDTMAYKQDWEGEGGVYFYNLVVENNEFKGWVQVTK